MTSLRRKIYFLLVLWMLFLWSCSLAGVIPSLRPGDKAPSFKIQTTEGLLSYNKDQPSDIKGPLIVVAFTNESGFLENLFADPKKFVFDLFENSPANAHYLFLFYDNAALSVNEDAGKQFKKLLVYQVYQYHNEKRLKYMKEMQRVRSLSNYRRKNLLHKTFLEHWKSKLHFANFPIHMLGNWIPRVLSQWYCSGQFCGLDQIAIENQQGNVLSVFRRLDARYTWLPSIKKLAAKKTRYVVVYVRDACARLFSVVVKGSLALVYSGQSQCSTFAKIRNAQSNGALGVIVYAKPGVFFEELNCHGKECETDLFIPATMVHNGDGFGLKEAPKGSMYARFQTTPSDMFTFGIDGQGRVRETSWSLYPSMRFLAYHAQWFNYVTDVVMNSTGDARIIPIFKDHLIQNSQGITTNVLLPIYKELLLYQNVEVDMSLTCPKTGPDACTHWDHVVRLFVSCDQSKKPGHEFARWIMGYGRRSSSWITPVRTVLPLLKTNSSEKCCFTLITEASVMPWIVTVNIRLSEKMKPKMNFTTWRQIENTLVPVEIVELFTGCFFDENCNKKYTTPKLFTVAKKIARVKLVATITGHGRDNNDCPRACLTTHRFIINNILNSTRTRVLKNAGSASGCEIDISDLKLKSQMNAQKMWLRGRQPWCDGQEVVPWEVDVTKFVRFGEVSNTIQYRVFYNGTDPRPIQDPGSIVMSSYLVYYMYEDLDGII